MKKIWAFFFLVFFTNLFLFSQTGDYYKITGHLFDKRTKTTLDNCTIKLYASNKTELGATSDSLGFFQIENIPVQAPKLVLMVERSNFYPTHQEVAFISTPHDTMIDIELSQIPVSPRWIPEVYFEDNTSIPDTSLQDFIDWIVGFLKSDTTSSLTIIGYKDLLEPRDLRVERAQFVYESLIEKGADKSRLKMETCDEPNSLKPSLVYPDIKTNRYDPPLISEEYIMNSPIDRRDSLRRLNRCVSLIIINK